MIGIKDENYDLVMEYPLLKEKYNDLIMLIREKHLVIFKTL